MTDRGGTAVCWHPSHPKAVAAADTRGRIHIPASVHNDPSWTDAGLSGFTPGHHSPARDLCFSPDGTRMAAVTGSDVYLFEPRRVGVLWRDRLPTARAEGGAFAVRFDPAGGRLLVAAADGEVNVWETGMDRIHAAGQGGWAEHALLTGEEAAGLELPYRAAAAFDAGGNLTVLYARLEGATRERVCRAGAWDGRAFDRGRRLMAGMGDDATVSAVLRGSAILARGREVIVAYRRQRERTGGDEGDLVLHDVRKGTSKTVGKGGNCWFDPHLFPGRGGELYVAHFSHDRDQTLLIDGASGADFVRVVPGRYGDGYNHSAATGGDGTMHSVFAPFLQAVARQPLTYLAWRPGIASPVRETVDDGTPGSYSLAVTPDGRPAVLHSRVAAGGHLELALSRRTSGGWQRETALDRLPDTRVFCPAVLSLACDPAGRFHALLRFQAVQGLFRLSDSSGAWLLERVCADVSHGCLLLDNAGRPVVLAWGGTGGGTSCLRLYTQ